MYFAIPLSSRASLQQLGSSLRFLDRCCLSMYVVISLAFVVPLPARAQYGNVHYGPNALASVTGGDYNTAIGINALAADENGSYNTACGAVALPLNVAGNFNTASGYGALYSNKGDSNTASGVYALFFNTTGYSNTASGELTLEFNETGYYNTGTGRAALFNNKSGYRNTATGANALATNVIGRYNTADGADALSNSTGSNNIALGYRAGLSLTTGNSNIDIGNTGVAGDQQKIRIGTKGTHNGTFIAGISGVPVTGTQVVVNSNGRLGVTGSSACFKKAVKPMDKASEGIHELKPVTFRYKEDIDPSGMPQFGLIAEEVEKVNPDLVVRDDEGKVTTVRYEAVNAMLLNEFLKEHRKVQDLEKQVAALTAGLQKVTARVEAANSVPRVVSNN